MGDEQNPPLIKVSLYFIGLILYTLIVLYVAFPNVFSFGNVETVHVAIFIFSLFLRRPRRQYQRSSTAGGMREGTQ